MLKPGLKIIFCLGLIFQVSLSSAQDSLDWKILEAAYEGDTNLVAQLLEQGADPNTATYDSTTALMYASAGGHHGIVWILLEAGADVNLGVDLQASPLIGAAGGGYLEICRTLLAAGALPDQKDPTGKTALMYASSMNEPSIAWLLLNYEASPEITDYKERRAIHYAADQGAYEVLGLLLDAGAEACPADTYGATPLHLAASYDDIAMVELLLQHGCKAETRDNNGLDAAAQAVIHRSAGVTTYLMDKDSARIFNWKNASRIALKTGQRSLYRTIKDSINVLIKEPITYANILDIQTTWNSKDHLVRASFRWMEGHSNIHWGIGFGMRLTPVRVLVEDQEIWYQYRERLYQLSFELGRTFSFASGNNVVFDISPGIGGGFNWANYRGVSTEQEIRINMLARLKATARWNNLGVFSGVSWSSLPQERISPLYIDMGISFRFNRLNFSKLSHII